MVSLHDFSPSDQYHEYVVIKAFKIYLDVQVSHVAYVPLVYL